MGRHYCRFNKKIGLLLGVVPESATGNAFAISNGWASDDLKKRIDKLVEDGVLDAAYNEQLGYLALTEK